MPTILPSLSRLRALRAVCRTGGFSAAARELLLTQSAVSNQIRQLEDETGVLLVERIGKSARPTPEGEILLACADDVLAMLNSTLQRIADMRGEVTGRFVFGAGSAPSIYLLPGLLSHFADLHPKVEVELMTGTVRELIPGLVDGSLDMLVAAAPISDPRLDQEPFFEDTQVCILPPTDETALTAVRPRDLAGRRLVLPQRHHRLRENIDAWLEAGCSPADAPPEILDVDLSEALKGFVMAGFGWAIISEIAVTKELGQGLLKALPLSPPLARQLVTVWRRDREANPAIKAMREIIAAGWEPAA